MVFHRRFVGRELHGLKVFWNREMRDATISERGSAGVIDHDQGMGGARDLNT